MESKAVRQTKASASTMLQARKEQSDFDKTWFEWRAYWRRFSRSKVPAVERSFPRPEGLSGAILMKRPADEDYSYRQGREQVISGLRDFSARVLKTCLTSALSHLAADKAQFKRQGKIKLNERASSHENNNRHV